MSPIELEKSVWTENDFDKMGWHDSYIYGIAFGPDYELAFDIDYIFKWMLPITPKSNYQFIVGPCTLVFEQVVDLKVDLDIVEPFELQIHEIKKLEPQESSTQNGPTLKTFYGWVIETQQGVIHFKAKGFKQFVREKPQIIDYQKIMADARRGITFAKQAFPNLV